MSLTDRFAGAVGSALGTAVRAFKDATGHGPARRPAFLDYVAQESRWKGGNYAADQSAAAIRAMQNSWVYMMINRKAMEKSAARMYVVSNPSGLEDEGQTIKNHDLPRIMRNPNPHMSGQFLSIYCDWWMNLLGNCYLYLAPDASGRLAEIWPLPAHRVNPWPGDKSRFVDYYEYIANGMIFNIPAENVYHEMFPNPFDPYRGLSPLLAAILASDSDSAMAEWNGAFFGQENVMPSAVITLSSGAPGVPVDEADVQRLKDQLTSEYAAINRRTAVAGAYDMKVALLGWSAREMDFLGGRQFTKEEIILILGGFPGMFDKSATEANATVADNMFKEKTIWPELGLRAGALTNQILRRYYGDAQEARYADIRPVNRELMVRESDASAGVLTVDERRQRFWDAGPLPDGAGAKMTQSQPQPATQPADEEPDDEPEEDIEELPNPASALPKAARSLPEDLKAWRWRSIKSLTDGRSLTLDFKTEAIPGYLKETILDGLGATQDEADVKAVFALAHECAEKGIIRSWRPWSGFEERLLAVVTDALLIQAANLENAIRGAGTSDPLADPALWIIQEQAMRDLLEPLFVELAAFGVARAQEAADVPQGITVNWGLVNQDVENWARLHAGEMVSNVTQTTRDAVAEQVALWSQTGEGIEGLLRRIESLRGEGGKAVFGPVRAEMIAITEATNLFAGANAQAWEAAGYAPVAYKPGAHVRCRCYLQPKTGPNGERLVAWYTAMDERVCTQSLKAPWGEVKGCAGLHRVIVSEGLHIGKKVDEL